MGIKRFFTRYNMLFKLISTLLIMICLPIMFVGWFTINQAYGTVLEQNKEQQVVSTMHFREYFKGECNAMITAMSALTTQQRVTRQALDEHPYNKYEAIGELWYSKMAVPVSSVCYLYFKGSDYIIGSSYNFQRDIFIRLLSGDDGEAAAELAGILDQTSAKSIEYFSSFNIASSSHQGMLVALKATVSTPRDAVVLFFISSASLRNSFLGVLEASDYNLYIFDGNGRLLIHGADNADIVNDVRFADFLSSGEDDLIIDIAGEDYRLYRETDSALGLSFVTAAKMSDIARPVESFYRIMIISIIAMIVVLFIMLFVVVYVNYRPVFNLARSVRANVSSFKTVAQSGEIEDIYNAIMEREAILGEVSEHRLQIAEHHINSLLDGKKVPVGELEKAGIHIADANLFVMMLHPMPSGAGWAERIGELGSEESVTIYHTRSSGGEVTIIAAAKDMGDDKYIRTARKIYRMAQNHAEPNSLRAGIGSLEESYENLNIACLKARISLDSAESGAIVFYGDVKSSFNYLEDYPTEAVMCFMQCVKQGDRAGSHKWLRDIIEQVSGQITSTLLEKYICYDIINNFNKTVVKLNISLPVQQLNNLLLSNDFEQLEQNMQLLVDDVCAEIEQRRNRENSSLGERIAFYVEQNLSDPDLDMNSAAEHHGVSVYMLYSLFKETFGVSFRSYLLDRRIEESQRLLRGTDLSVKEVCARVGFRDPSYFIKVFKKVNGCTPAQYR